MNYFLLAWTPFKQGWEMIPQGPMSISTAPYSLSAQFSFMAPEPIVTGKKVSKLRNKKVKEKPAYDILQLDGQIKACFGAEKEKIPEYRKRILSMIRTMSNLTPPFGIEEKILEDIGDLMEKHKTPTSHESHGGSHGEIRLSLTYRQFLDFYEQLKRLITKTENLASDALYRRYLELTEGIIGEYKQILSVPIRTAFLAKSNPRDANDERKKELLNVYLKIASNFINLEYTQEVGSPGEHRKYTCSCGNSHDFEVAEGMSTCRSCGDTTPVISAQTSFKDQERINVHAKYKYEKRSHFRDGILQFQGKQNKRIDPGLYQQANEWLEIHGLLNLDAGGKKERYARVRREHIRLFMSESDDKAITDHYEDLNLIFGELTGTPCPDISHLEEKLYAQFDKLVEGFLTLPDIDRTNFLNSQFVLRKLLLINNYKIDPSLFPGLKTITRLNDHEDIFRRLALFAGLNCPVG